MFHKDEVSVYLFLRFLRAGNYCHASEYFKWVLSLQWLLLQRECGPNWSPLPLPLGQRYDAPLSGLLEALDSLIACRLCQDPLDTKSNNNTVSNSDIINNLSILWRRGSHVLLDICFLSFSFLFFSLGQSYQTIDPTNSAKISDLV